MAALLAALCVAWIALARGEAGDEDFVRVSSETRLVHELLSRYAKLGTTSSRPRLNASEAVTLRFGLRLITLELDENHQTLTTSAWLRHLWYDHYLKWDPQDYGGIKYIILPSTAVWMPEDILLVNSAEAQIQERPVDLQVKYNGRVLYVPHRVFRSGCLVDLTHYPFDIQICELWIQSASRYSSNLSLEPWYYAPLDLDTYLGSFKQSREWDIIGNASSRVSQPREAGAILMYSRRTALRFSLTLRRRVGFTAMLVMLPCVLLSFLVPVIFCLPPERPDRHMIAMSLFASFMVLLLLLTETAPPSAASVPTLGIYYLINLVMLIMAILCSVFVINVSKRHEYNKPFPDYMKPVLAILGRVLCYPTQRLHSPPPSASDPKSLNAPPPQRSAATPSPSLYPRLHQNGHSPASLSTADDNRELSSAYSLVGEGVGVEGGEKRAGAGAGTGEQTAVWRRQWKAAADILDRFFGLVFLLANLVSLAILFPRPSDKYLNAHI